MGTFLISQSVSQRCLGKNSVNEPAAPCISNRHAEWKAYFNNFYTLLILEFSLCSCYARVDEWSTPKASRGKQFHYSNVPEKLLPFYRGTTVNSSDFFVVGYVGMTRFQHWEYTPWSQCLANEMVDVILLFPLLQFCIPALLGEKEFLLQWFFLTLLPHSASA